MRSQSTFKSGKHAFTFLVVICGRKKTVDGTFHGFNIKTQKPSLLPGEDKPLILPNNVDVERELSQRTVESGHAQELSDRVTAGQLEVQVLECPTREELKQKLEALEPEIVQFQGEQVSGTDEIGPLELSDCQISSPDTITSLFDSKLPEVVYLETSASSKLGEAFYGKGVPYVIFWKGSVTYKLAVHFNRAFIAVLQSSASQIWSAFQLANASFRLHCGRLKTGAVNGQQKCGTLGPIILGGPPPKLVEPLKTKDSEEGDSSPVLSPTVTIYDDEIDLPILVCAEPCSQDISALKALEDGLNALLMVEIKCMRLLHHVSAPPPPSVVPTLARGVVTMRCDLCTSSFARISLLVTGSAQICFDDQILEYSIKKELLEKGQLVFALAACGENKPVMTPELRRSAAVACGASVVEILFRTPTWATQVLRQLAPEISFHSLVALGIAGIQGFPVAAFQKEDTDHLLSLRSSKKLDTSTYNRPGTNSFNQLPSWLASPLPSRKRRKSSSPGNLYLHDESNDGEDVIPAKSNREDTGPLTHHRQGKTVTMPFNRFGLSLAAAMKPVPHANQNRQMPFAGAVLAGAHSGWTMKISLPNGTGVKNVKPNTTASPIASNPVSSLPVLQNRQPLRTPSPAQMLSLNPFPMKKHGCNRRPIYECSEEEFVKDVMQFLISRGHTRLVPSTGLEAFPDAILNGKRLDIYNLYKEVVSRGGFHVGNGINWKGQIFAKMHNHTLINKMTGVGNSLKKHYETYLLEYELAHEDVDGECCILCHSSAAGDWVNCGICGEWAHFGCDKRNGLGAFKDYSKTDGLEYICPRCSATNSRGATGRRKLRNPISA